MTPFPNVSERLGYRFSKLTSSYTNSQVLSISILEAITEKNKEKEIFANTPIRSSSSRKYMSFLAGFVRSEHPPTFKKGRPIITRRKSVGLNVEGSVMQ